MVTRVVLINARSICNKTAIIYNILEQGCDLACITETWLDENAAPILQAAIPPGFSRLLQYPRLHQRGGGVAIFFRSDLKCKGEKPLEDIKSFEYMIVKCVSEVKFKILLLYRPPRWSPEFSTDLSNLISHLLSESPRLLVLGDFNVRIGSDNLALELLNLMQKFGFTQSVETDTHEGGHMLDLVFSRGIPVNNMIVEPVAWSDHYLMRFEVGAPLAPARPMRQPTYHPNHSQYVQGNTFQEMALASDILSSCKAGIKQAMDTYNLVLSSAASSPPHPLFPTERSILESTLFPLRPPFEMGFWPWSTMWVNVL
ncbi:uncharacterized protein LOC102354552 [Latimeria chalumnae]|uniref:uncharacterized protein LOC102354552 n=1 Tax=Latimeria chalumnae TaxID=7897 RepID=UPI0003C18FCD|nr:PREDICTED: uncharacterized protein LOC102354552 [Latimeria chalumnae]XP_005987356.1 PREDICTED: uncharacterized protein LOC102354552 [Latimeria chalumnae]|eukprot:XP_005987355.1 PREDICTED: uncharacterized protein LOC102354552 [Latimeria chalumnae]